QHRGFVFEAHTFLFEIFQVEAHEFAKLRKVVQSLFFVGSRDIILDSAEAVENKMRIHLRSESLKFQLNHFLFDLEYFFTLLLYFEVGADILDFESANRGDGRKYA